MKASCQHDRYQWLKIQSVSLQPNSELEVLDLGERSAILLVESLGADLLAIDEMVGRRIARSWGLRITETLEILKEAGRLGWIDLPAVLTSKNVSGLETEALWLEGKNHLFSTSEYNHSLTNVI